MVELREGVAVPIGDTVRRFLDETNIVEPKTLVLVTPKDGERYLRALAVVLSRGYYSHVRLIE